MPPFDQRRPFSRAEALAAGMTDWQLRSQQRLHRDVYVGAGVPLDLKTRALAALRLAPPGTLVARETAAVLLGGIVPDTAMVHLLLREGRLRARGVDARAGRRTRWARLGGIPLTSAEDTFVDLGAELGLVDLVVLGDSLVQEGPDQPGGAAVGSRASARSPGAHHQAGCRSGAGGCRLRTRVETAPAHRPRGAAGARGEPHRVRRAGWVRRRFDLSWPATKLAVEYDGRQHAESQRQWEHDVGLEARPTSDEWRTFFPDWSRGSND